MQYSDLLLICIINDEPVLSSALNSEQVMSPAVTNINTTSHLELARCPLVFFRTNVLKPI